MNPTGGGSGDKVSLEMKLEKGAVYKQLTKTEQKFEQTMMGMKTKIASTTEIYLKNEVLNVDADGVAEIKCTYERVKMEMDNPMLGKRTFDSSDSVSDALPEAIGYNGLVGKSIVFKLDKRGTVVSIQGVDSLFDDIMGSIDGADKGPEMDKMRQTLKGTFSHRVLPKLSERRAYPCHRRQRRP